MPSAPTTSRERLLTALKLGQPDRVPVTLYELDPFSETQWQAADPTYDRLRSAARDLQDSMSFAPLPLGPFLSDPNAQGGRDGVSSRTWIEDGSTLVETRVETPAGRTLTAVSRHNPGVHSPWRIKAFIEDEDDLAAFLSLPDGWPTPDLSATDEAEASLGDHGLVLFSLGDPIGVVLGIIPFHLYAEWSASASGRANVHALLDVMHRRTYRLVEHLTARSRGRVFRFWGPEYAGPSLMPPRLFREYVVDYLADVVALVRQSGNLALVHCHARLDAILEMIAEIGPDGLEPIECRPAPSGDVDLAGVKRRIGDHICLMGNIQGPLLETGEAQEVERAVRLAIDEGAPGGGFILMPTAMPVTSLDARMERNLLAMLETARRHGGY